MKKLMIFLVMACFAASSLQAVTSPEKKDFLGEWQFESPYAPEGYQKGIFFIQEKEGALSGEIQFGDGYKVEMKDMVIADGVLKFGINLDFEYVNIKASIDDNLLKGSAASSEGELPFEAKRVKEQ